MKDKLGTDINVGDTVAIVGGRNPMILAKVIDAAPFAIYVQLEHFAGCSTVRTRVIGDTSQCVVCAGSLKV